MSIESLRNGGWDDGTHGWPGHPQEAEGENHDVYACGVSAV